MNLQTNDKNPNLDKEEKKKNIKTKESTTY